MKAGRHVRWGRGPPVWSAMQAASLARLRPGEEIRLRVLGLREPGHFDTASAPRKLPLEAHTAKFRPP